MPKVLWAYCHNINPICPKYFGHIVKWSRKYRKICPNSVTYIIIDNDRLQGFASFLQKIYWISLGLTEPIKHFEYK